MKSSYTKALWLAPFVLLVVVIAIARPQTQKKESSAKANAYPAPHWPSYLKKPKSVEDILPHARDLVRNKAGFGGNSPGLGLGLLQPGEEVMIVPDTTAEDFVVQALLKALEERGVQAEIVPNYSLVGVSKADAEQIRLKTEIRSAEDGFMEAKYYWIERVFTHPEVPKEWLKQKNPDLYNALYPKRDEMTPELSIAWKKLTNESVGAALRDYLQQHPKIKGVYWGHPGGAFYARTMAPLEGKYLGRCSFTNSWEVVSQVSSFPGWCLPDRLPQPYRRRESSWRWPFSQSTATSQPEKTKPGSRPPNYW